MSKYKALWEHLKENNAKQIELLFDEIKDILGFEIDHSFLTYKKEAREYGYEVEKISMRNKIVYFKKI